MAARVARSIMNRSSLALLDHLKVSWCLLFWLVAVPALGTDAPSPWAICIDTSSSMSGEKIAAAVEAANLLVFLCDAPVVIGHFADDGCATNMIPLLVSRAAAMAEVNRLPALVGGGTAYVAGMRALPS